MDMHGGGVWDRVGIHLFYNLLLFTRKVFSADAYTRQVVSIRPVYLITLRTEVCEYFFSGFILLISQTILSEGHIDALIAWFPLKFKCFRQAFTSKIRVTLGFWDAPLQGRIYWRLMTNDIVVTCYYFCFTRFEANFSAHSVHFSFKSAGLPEVLPGQVKIAKRGHRMEIVLWSTSYTIGSRLQAHKANSFPFSFVENKPTFHHLVAANAGGAFLGHDESIRRV